MNILEIPVSAIRDNPHQTRQIYDEAKIKDLAADIKARGLLQAPVGRLVPAVPMGNQLPETALEIQHAIRIGTYVVQLALGHSRLRAVRDVLQLETMPVTLRQLTGEQMAEMAWAENEQRSDLSPVEKARAIEHMMAAFGWSQTETAERLGLDRSTVSNRLRLLKLPENVLEALAAGTVSERTALALVPLWQLPEELEPYADVPDAIGVYRFYSRSVIVERALSGQSTSDQIRDAVSRFPAEAQNRKEWMERNAEREKKEAEAEAKLKRKLEKVEKARKAGEEVKPILKLSELKYDQYERLERGRIPAGCSGECVCFAEAIGYQSEIVRICLDPKQHRKLKAAETREAKKDRKKLLKEDLRPRIETAFASGIPKRLAALVLRSVISANDVKAEDLRGGGVPEEIVTKLRAWQEHIWLPLMMQMEGAQLMEMAARVLVERKVRWYMESTSSKELVELLDAIEADAATVPPFVVVPPSAVGVCRGCGCTSEDCGGCIERTGVACSWVEPDLCSTCAVLQQVEEAAAEVEAA